jgi:hypothetical protein
MIKNMFQLGHKSEKQSWPDPNIYFLRLKVFEKPIDRLIKSKENYGVDH